ncbi:uncharacterized protein HMPREF1541_05855 [Cyphellophora europaea CBS 101466]|uniref:Uncharacterized protein n=1 Tax=Cyphellophora europaea (strain CBS 101466) TaxID=1220924 RepID=W2RV95_CYPE1|nr:uncharacterized protein HMPREF1541_05855 [Cyphellophora europaea CBS 101466]ETN39629.1 hypothetical protein HMPREF1541_05855 [Cyphellophora europaea CBS 101466]
MEQLLFEADLGHTRELGTRLLDQPSRRQDLDLWLFILDINRQRRGLEGVKATWRGMRYRGKSLRLDADNANARDLIDAFIFTGITEDLEFLKDVCRLCIHRRYLPTELFVGVVGGLLRYRPEEAPSFAFQIREKCYQGKDDLLRTFHIACESESAEALRYFRGVRDLLPDTKIYHDTVPHLWQQNKPQEAFEWHRYLLAKRDQPKTFDILLPFIGYLAHTGQELEPFLHGLQAAGVEFTSQARRVYWRERQRAVQDHPHANDLNSLKVSVDSQRKLKDETIARALATSSFSFDFIVNGIIFLGAVEFGPLSVRQLVLSSPDLATLEARFGRLRELEVDTGSSVFVNVIRRLRSSRNFDLIRLMADSDMHHDEFSDLDLQRRLLTTYQARGSLPDITRTLTILNGGDTDSIAQERSTNFLLRSAIIRHDWRLVLSIVDSLHRTGHRITLTVLNQLIVTLLPRRHAKVQSIPTPDFDTLSYLLALLLRLLPTTTTISPSHFLRPLIALASHHRISELHSLCTFLAHHFKSSNRTPGTDADLGKLFTSPFQRALISWDFKCRKWRDELFSKTPSSVASSSSSPTSPPPKPWLAGAKLLRQLRDEYGVKVDLADVQEEYLFRLRQMSRAEGRWKLVSNRQSAAMRGYGVREMVEGWAAVWDLLDGGDSGGDMPDANELTRKVRKRRETLVARLARGFDRLRGPTEDRRVGNERLRKKKNSRYLTGPPLRSG